MMSARYSEQWLANRLAKRALRRCSVRRSKDKVRLAEAKPKPNKYRNRKTEVDGQLFDSAKEAARYQELVLLERAGEISNLSRQVKFSLEIEGHHICNYFADFCYDEKGEVIVEDVKSKATRTREFIIKKKLMHALYHIEIRET